MINRRMQLFSPNSTAVGTFSIALRGVFTVDLPPFFVVVKIRTLFHFGAIQFTSRSLPEVVGNAELAGMCRS
jgi:hypothetical protein